MPAEYENAPLGEKRRVLVAASPSPRKRRNIDGSVKPPPPLPLPTLQPLPIAHVPRASNILSVLASTNDSISSEPQETVSFYARLPKNTIRDPETLRIVERLELGPYEHKPHKEDPEFENLEPHSGLRLKSRSMSHKDLSDYMSGKYYISPSTLYSIATLSPSKETYEIPVEGDWVTVAVIAHREDVRLSNPPQRNDGDNTQHGPPKNSKYIKLRLVDFGAADSDGATRGDAMLNMLLFEASSVHEIKEDDSKSRGKKIYKGGSGGAFEASAKYREGAVISVLNPIVLRPFKGSQGTPHPTQNILAIKPCSPDYIQVIGQSKDLGLCSATKREGSSCGSWYDRRSSNVCEYHIQAAVKSRRAARPEFSVATSGMQTSAVPFRKGANKPTFDPLQKRGLLPSSGSQLAPRDAGATYIIDGYALDTTTKYDPSDRYIHEHMGRDKEERRKRQNEGDQADKWLLEHLTGQETLLTTGAKALRMAREQLVDGKNKKGEIEESMAKKKTRRSAFSASTLQRIGFDPTLKRGVEKKSTEDPQRKLEVLSKAGGSGIVRLGKPPKRTDEDKAQLPVNKAQEEVKGGIDSDSDLEIV